MDGDDDFAIFQSPWYGDFMEASMEQEVAEVAVMLSAARRAHAVAQMRASGFSAIEIASAVGLTRERVGQLVRKGRAQPDG